MALKESNKDRKKRLEREAEPTTNAKNFISIDKVPYFQPTVTHTKWIIGGVIAVIVALLII